MCRACTPLILSQVVGSPNLDELLWFCLRCFLECSSLVSVSPPFPNSQLFESALWNPGKVMEAGVCFLQIRNGGQKGFCAQEPHRVLLGFNTSNNEACVCRQLYFSKLFSKEMDRDIVSWEFGLD